MKNKKAEAVKRIRRSSNSNKNLPVIIGLSGGILILAVILVAVFVFVIKGKKQNFENSQTSMSEIGKNIGTEARANELDENIAVINQEKTDKKVSERSGEDDASNNGNVDEAVEMRLKEMSVEQKIDQLFILKPIALVNLNVDDTTEKIIKINQVGDITRSAFTNMQIGGMLISRDNTDDTTGEVKTFVYALQELAYQTYDMPLYLGVVKDEYELGEKDGVYGGFEPDFIVNATETELLLANQLNAKYFEDNVDLEQIVTALSSGSDVIIINADFIDYETVRTEIARKISEEEINEKVRKIILSKIVAEKSDISASELPLENSQDVRDEKIQTEALLNNNGITDVSSDSEMSEPEMGSGQIKLDSEEMRDD